VNYLRKSTVLAIDPVPRRKADETAKSETDVNCRRWWRKRVISH
jgi:hypothetical protein